MSLGEKKTHQGKDVTKIFPIPGRAPPQEDPIPFKKERIFRAGGVGHERTIREKKTFLGKKSPRNQMFWVGGEAKPPTPPKKDILRERFTERN